MLLPRRLVIGIVSVSTCVWLGNFTLPIFDVHYKSDPTIDGVYMAVIGSALALQHNSAAQNARPPAAPPNAPPNTPSPDPPPGPEPEPPRRHTPRRRRRGTGS